ncbi:mandelate racemase/muconate lactonizing enzyme family protein [Halorussus salinisoli]|uniref:mandelate racemase/muconate lactonizing enzyme family protein n=1 Tax=Halorussus salinisoli TaxID=2558242 RepID=UPI0010C1608F|nr:mandelate racemase/muconate lactonizing enzyme family protein [Halorussus salinisoli]
MKITNVTAHALSSPIRPAREHEFLGGTRKILKRDFVLVTVETADGEIGYAPAGASSSAMREYFDGATHRNFVEVIDDVIEPTLEDEVIDDVTAAHDLIDDINIPGFLRSQIISAIDIALHDIIGKRQNAPIYELLLEQSDVTADPDRTLPLYASGGMYMPPEGYAEEAAGLAEYGFEGYKYRPGLGPEEDLRTIRLIREEVGDEMEIMVDAHTWWKMGDKSYSPDQVRELTSKFQDYDVYWVEEPVEPEAHSAYQELREATGTPLAGGESEESPQGLKRLADTGAVDFLQGDVRHHRGFTGCGDVVEHCEGADVTFVPHHFGTHLGLVANAHLVAAAPGSELLEYPVFETSRHPGMYPFPLAEDILESPFDVEGGELTVPDEPGLGVDVNLDVLTEYPYEEGAWTEFHYDEA